MATSRWLFFEKKGAIVDVELRSEYASVNITLRLTLKVLLKEK